VRGNQTTFAILAVPAQQQVYFCPEQGMPLKYDIQQDCWYQYTLALQEDIVQVGLSQSSQKKPKYAAFLESLAKLTPFDEFKAGSAYKFCMILEDRVDIYPRFHPTCEWDTSAGQCLLERIGGGLVDFQGRPFSYNQRETLLNGGFIAYKTKDMQELAFQALAEMQERN